jgi:predicted RNA-binding Zn ribbon-like protein
VELRLLAGHPALDFVNTIDPREGDHRIEHLGIYPDLVRWAERAGVLTAAEARRAARGSARDRAGASRAFARAVELREALYAVFAAVAAKRPVPAPGMGALHAAYRDAIVHASLAREGRRFRWRTSGGLDVVRWHIARAAVALLESEILGRVKRCPGSGDCGWLFLDNSKNASRRWCSMDGCGNRAKVRRFLRRQKPRTAPSGAIPI